MLNLSASIFAQEPTKHSDTLLYRIIKTDGGELIGHILKDSQQLLQETEFMRFKVKFEE
jgi:hypothetical protein